MSNDNKATARRFYESISAGNLDIIDVPFADIVRFEDGKVVEHWGVTDGGALMQQLQGQG